MPRLGAVTLSTLLLVMVVGPIAATRSAGTTDWSGTYDGRFSDAATTQIGDHIYANSVHFAVNNFELTGRLEVQGQSTGQDHSSSLAPNFTIGLCLGLNVVLAAGELRGVPIAGNEVDWTGPVTVQVGIGDPKKVNCAGPLPTREI